MRIGRLLLSTVFLLCLFASCSGNEDVSPADGGDGNTSTYYPKINIVLSKNSVSLFEEAQISFNRNYDHLPQYKPSLKLEDFDSVKWLIPGVYLHTSTRSHELISKGQSFSLPSTYSIYITGYYSDSIVARDSATITVSNNDQFLAIDWNNPVGKKYYPYSNRFGNYYLNLSYKSTTAPHALLEYYIDTPYSSESEWAAAYNASGKLLLNYVTTLYGKPKLSYDGTNPLNSALDEEYKARFKTSCEEVFGSAVKSAAVAIWEDVDSYIALIAAERSVTESGYYRYSVIAEPRVK